MKIIHCGDIHLDSKIESNLPPAKSRERKKEIIMAFCKMVDYAAENGVTAVIIAGDLFDSDRMLQSTRDIVLGKISGCANTDFLYLCGNHDAGKALAEGELPDNLKLFSDRWTSYTYENVTITGAELTADNCRHIYDSLVLPKGCFNIVTMHGQLSSSVGEDMVNRTSLAEKGIDYLALGHYHSFDKGNLGKNGMWCYSGCLEGRGFDECKDKGFAVLDIAADGTYTHKFVKNSLRDITEVECDITGLCDTAEILQSIDSKCAAISENAMVKVVLTGNVPAGARKDTDYLLKHLNERFWFAKVKDKTRIQLRAEDYENDISLKGEFIRQVKSAGLDEAMCDRVIECGLAALSGQEVQ